MRTKKKDQQEKERWQKSQQKYPKTKNERGEEARGIISVVKKKEVHETCFLHRDGLFKSVVSGVRLSHPLFWCFFSSSKSCMLQGEKKKKERVKWDGA